MHAATGAALQALVGSVFNSSMIPALSGAASIVPMLDDDDDDYHGQLQQAIAASLEVAPGAGPSMSLGDCQIVDPMACGFGACRTISPASSVGACAGSDSAPEDFGISMPVARPSSPVIDQDNSASEAISPAKASLALLALTSMQTMAHDSTAALDLQPLGWSEDDLLQAAIAASLGGEYFPPAPAPVTVPAVTTVTAVTAATAAAAAGPTATAAATLKPAKSVSAGGNKHAREGGAMQWAECSPLKRSRSHPHASLAKGHAPAVAASAATDGRVVEVVGYSSGASTATANVTVNVNVNVNAQPAGCSGPTMMAPEGPAQPQTQMEGTATHEHQPAHAHAGLLDAAATVADCSDTVGAGASVSFDVRPLWANLCGTPAQVRRYRVGQYVYWRWRAGGAVAPVCWAVVLGMDGCDRPPELVVYTLEVLEVVRCEAFMPLLHPKPQYVDASACEIAPYSGFGAQVMVRRQGTVGALNPCAAAAAVGGFGTVVGGDAAAADTATACAELAAAAAGDKSAPQVCVPAMGCDDSMQPAAGAEGEGAGEAQGRGHGDAGCLVSGNGAHSARVNVAATFCWYDHCVFRRLDVWEGVVMACVVPKCDCAWSCEEEWVAFACLENVWEMGEGSGSGAGGGTGR